MNFKKVTFKLIIFFQFCGTGAGGSGPISYNIASKSWLGFLSVNLALPRVA